MSAPDELSPKTAEPARRVYSLPHAWTTVAAGLVVVILAGVMCVLILDRYLARRPLNLADYTATQIRTIEDLLASNGVPRSAIRRTLDESHRDRGARWRRAEIDVQLPRMVSVDGMVNLIRKEMTLYNASVYEERLGTADSRVRVAVGDREFAIVGLKGAWLAPTPPASPAASGALQEGRETVATVSAQVPETAQEAPTAPSEHAEDVDDIAEGPSLADTGMAIADAGDGFDAETAQGGSAKAAIIVDDGGENGEVSDLILSLSSNLTLSILPNASSAAGTAERARALGFEVVLHMPMEAGNAGMSAPGSITTEMALAEIRRVTEAALANVPGAAGANNHTGSKFTADETAIAAFLEVLLERGLYFVDSRTTDATKAYMVAKRIGVPAIERDVFLDNDPDPESIRRQTRLLIDTAKAQGHAVGICHFRPSTATLLGEIIADVEMAGVELVHVSELVN